MKHVYALSISIFTGFVLYGQGYQVNFQGQKQTAMGGAGNALVSDASSLFYNPGAMARLESSSIDLGFTPIFSNILFTEQGTNAQSRTQSPMGTPFSAYGVYKPKEGKWAAGLGIYTPFGSTVEWEPEWTGRFAITRLALRSIYFQPSFSYQLHERISLGAGFSYIYGTVNLQKDIPVQFSDGSYASAELDGTATGYGFNVGAHVKVTEELNIGLSYRSEAKMSVSDGMATFNVPEALDANFPDSTFSAALPLPQVLTLGFSYDLGDKWEFALDVNYVGWKSYDTLAFDYAVNTSSLEDTKSARMYEDAFAFRGGANYKFNDAIEARVGLAYAITPVQDGYVTPETPDNNRINLSAGIAYRPIKQLTIDLNCFYTQLKRESINYETNLSGDFFTKVIAPGIGLGYKF